MKLFFIITLIGCVTSQPMFQDQVIKNLPCDAISQILVSDEVRETLLLDEAPKYYNKVRVFTPGATVESCANRLDGWKVDYYLELRPSLNTGYHRDIVIYYRDDLTPCEYQVYIPSHSHYQNRQTTYIVRFIQKEESKLSVVGFAEYTDN